MIRIKALIVASGIFSAGVAVAGDLAKSNWPCGPSLLPCRAGITTATQTLPYWRGSLPEQPLRVTYRPAFARTKR